jgi:phosphoglycerate dehydrogenase-like enzyme
MSQALVTPHIAGDTDLALLGTLAYVAQVVQGWGAGRKPASIVNQLQHPRRPYK